MDNDDRIFEARLQKIGDSQGILIPSKILEDLGISDGDIVHVRILSTDTVRRNKILLELAGIDKKKPKFKREKEDR